MKTTRVYCHYDDQIKFGVNDGRSTIIHPECVGGPAGLVPGTGEVCSKCQGRQYFYMEPELEQAGKQKVEAL